MSLYLWYGFQSESGLAHIGHMHLGKYQSISPTHTSLIQMVFVANSRKYHTNSH